MQVNWKNKFIQAQALVEDKRAIHYAVDGKTGFCGFGVKELCYNASRC